MEDKKDKGPGWGAWLFAGLFTGLVYKGLGRWLKKWDLDIQKDGFILYVLVLAAAWCIGLVLMILGYLGWLVYRLVH